MSIFFIKFIYFKNNFVANSIRIEHSLRTTNMIKLIAYSYKLIAYNSNIDINEFVEICAFKSC